MRESKLDTFQSVCKQVLDDVFDKDILIQKADIKQEDREEIPGIQEECPTSMLKVEFVISDEKEEEVEIGNVSKVKEETSQGTNEPPKAVENLVSCSKCEYTSKWSGDLKKHFKSKHEGVRFFSVFLAVTVASR